MSHLYKLQQIQQKSWAALHVRTMHARIQAREQTRGYIFIVWCNTEARTSQFMFVYSTN